MSTRTISTLEELKAFRDEVNAGNTFKGETIELANDIDLGGEEWTPIGTQSHQFQGTFNGNGHTISNLKINTPYRSDVGFFGFTTNGEIKNLTFNNAEVTGYCDVGVVAGTPYTSKYSNIKLTGDIKVSGYAYVGGMFGKNAYADLTDLTIDANAGSYVKADSENYRTYVGGIVGFMGEGNQTVMNVISNISVIGSTCDIGGIAGIAHYGNKFINVVCTAELIQLVNANDDGDHLEIGGIAEVWLNQSEETVLLLNCSAENTTLKSSLKGVDRSEDVKGNDITGRSYSEETSTSGSLIIGNAKTSETGSEYVFTVSGPKAADDLKSIFGDSLQDNGDGTYTSTTFDMSAIYVNEAWAGKKNGDMVEYGVIGVNAFAKANDAINAAGANATIKIQDARDYNTPITRVSYTENLTIEAQEDDYSQLYMTVSGKTYTYGEEDENGNAVRHDATVEYKGQDIFFGGHSHFESLAGMTVKFTSTEVTHEGGTPFFKVYGDSNVVFDGANYANDNGNLWFYVSGQLDLQNSSNLATDGGSGFRILAAGGKVNVDKSSLLQVIGSNISIGSYYVYGDKTAKAVVGGKKQGHDADGNNDYSATLNITNGSGLVNENGIVRVGASYILDNATTDELEGLTITDNPDKPANYADLAKAYLNITDASAAELDRLYVDGNGAVTIRNSNSTLTANSITLADGSSLTLDTAATVTVGALAAADGTITIDASSYTDGLYKLIDVTGNAKVDYSKILTAFGENLTVIDNDLWIGAVDRSTILVDSRFAGKYNVGDPIEGLEGFFYGFNAFASAENMFDNIHDTTTTLKFFGEQELVTDATTGAANNRNFNIRAKQDLSLTADDAATLTLTVKDSSWEHGGSTNNVGELAFLSDSDDAVQTITIGENVTIDTNAKIWFGRTAVTKEVHATNVIINGSIIQKPHKDATSEHPNASLYGIHQIQVEKGSTVTLNGSMLFGWSLLVKGGTFNVTENASLTWDVDAFAQTNGNVEVESRQETGGQFNVSGSKNVNLRSLTIKDSASSASFTNGAEAIFIDYITLVEGSSITVDAASTVTTGTLTNNGTITIDATGVTSGSHKVIDTDAIAGTGSIIAKDGTLADDMNLVIADNDVYVTDQKQDVIYVGGVNAAGEKSANTAAPAEAIQGWNKFDTMKDAFKAGALGNNTIDFGNAGRVVSDKAFTNTKETVELGEGEYTIINGKGAYLPRLTMNARDVVINIKNAHVTLSKYRSGKDSNGELGGAVLNITDSRVDGGNEVDGLMWVTSYADSTIEITNSRVGLCDSYTGEAENVTLGNTGNYLDWGSYGNLALKVSGTAVIKDSTIFAGYYFSTIGDADGATIDVTNSVVYASAVETDGTNGLASLRLNNSALRQSGWGNGSENYNFLVKKGATVSLTKGSNLWWARAAQVRVPYVGELCDSIVIDNGGKLELFYDSTAEVGNITNNGELVIYESTLKAMTITNNNYFAINNNSAITAEFSAAGTGFITVQDAAFGADTVINSTASYTNQGIGSEILMFGTTLLANGANISTGWSKDLRIGFGSNAVKASISITSGAKLTVGGSTYIGSATEDQGDAAYTVFVTGAGSEFNGSGAGGDLYLRADGMLTIQNEASASFSYFNGKGVLNVLNATFKALNFNIADSGKLSIVNGAKATLGNTATASTARGDISVKGDKTELNLIGDIKYGRTNTAADFTVKNNATVTVDGNIELGYFTQVSGVMFFYKSNLSLTNNTKFTTTETIKVFLNSAIAMDYTSRLTFGGLSAQSGSITIAVSGYTDGIYKVMENTGANAVDYATVISNWSEIEKVGCTVVNNSLYIGSVDMTKLLVSADYSKYSTGDAIEGKDGFFYGFNAFTTAKDALKAANANGGAVIDLQNDGYVYAAPSYDTMKINKAGIYKLTGGNGTLLNYTLEINSDQTDDAYTFNIENANLTLTKLTLRKNTEMNITDSRVDYNFFEGGSAYLSVYGNSVLKISNSTVGDNPNAKQKSEGIFAPTWTVYGTLEVTDSTLYSYVGQGNQSGFNASGNGQISLTNSNISLSLITVGYEYEAKKLNPGADEDNLLATMLFDNTEVKNTQYRGDYNTKNGILVGSEDGKTAGKLIIRNGSNVDFTLKRYEDKREVGLSILNGKSSVEITTGSTLKTPSVTNAGTISVTNSVLYVNGTLTNSGTINVKAGKNVSFKAGALTNNGEFAVDGGSYQGGTVKVIDLDSINGAEIIVNNIDSKYVYRGDDGDVLFSDASKEILKGNTSWSSIAFGDAVTEAGTDFYKGVNAFDNGTGLWAQFEENVTTEVEIGAGDFTDGNATSAIHRFIGGKNVVIRSTAAGDDYAVLSKDSTFEYGVADEATIDADYTITLEGNQQYDWLQVRAAQKDWQTGSTEAGKQIKLNADGTAQTPDHLITLNVNGKVIAKTLNVKEGTLINIDASKGGSLTGNGNGGGGYVVRGMMNVIGKNGTDFDSEATLNLNGAAFTVGYAPNSSKVRGPAFVNITDKAVVTNIMHSFLNFQAPGSILNVDNAKLDVGHIQEATAGNASCDFTFNVKNKADVHAKNSIVLGQDAQNGDDGIFSFNVENSTVAADWNIELKTFSDTTLSTSKMSAAKDFILNGNLSMQNDSTLTVGGNFTNTGSISVGSGSSLDVGTFINQGTFNLNWNASLKMGSFDATSSSITIDMTGFDNKEHALVVVNNPTLDETAVISIVGQDFYDKYKGYLRYDGNTLYLTENLSAEVYVSSSWAGKGQGETVDYNGNTYTIGTNAFGTVEEAKAVNPLLIHIVDGTISKTALEAVKTVLEGDATYTGVITAGTRVNDGVDNRRTVDGDTNVTVNSGTFKSNLIGADSQISGSIRRNGNVTLTINGGNFEKQIAGGMYFYAQNPFDEAVLVGNVNMTINGGTFDARVYGGNFAYLDNEFSAQTKLIGDINLTINATNEITFNEHVTAGSRGTGRIYGDINVKVTGEGSKLNFTGKLIGDSNAGGFYKTASGYGEQTYVSGDRIVEFANFQGDFNAELLMFKTLNFSEGTNMTFTSVRLDVSNVSEWNFGFGTELNINAGLNSFEGDELAFELDGWDNSSDWTAINGAKDSMIAGWDKAGSVSFFLNGSEYAASWDTAAGAWCNSELGVKLGLGDDQKSLLIGKLA